MSNDLALDKYKCCINFTTVDVELDILYVDIPS